jgi:hypothetical protein
VKQTELAVVKGNSIKQLKATNWSLKRLLLCNTKNQKTSEKARRSVAIFCLEKLERKPFHPYRNSERLLYKLAVVVDVHVCSNYY